MLRAFGRAMLAPMRRPLKALLAALILVGLPLLAAVLLNIWQITSLSPTSSFFVPDALGDPVMLQHALWLIGGTGGMRTMLALSILVFGPLAYAIWWRALDGTEGRLRMGALGRVAIWLWLALSVFLLSGVFYALVPVSDPAVDGALLNVLAAVAIVLLARFQARISMALGGVKTPMLGWALCLGCAVIIVLFALLMQILGIFAWMGVMGFGSSGFRSPDPETPIWITRLRLLDWQPIFVALAFAYTSLVAVAFLREPRSLRSER